MNSYWKFRILIFALLFTLMVSTSFASEPSRIGIEEVLAKGRAAFVGRIVALKEVNGNRYKTEVQIEVELTKCFYGLDCGIHTLYLKYYNQIWDEQYAQPSFELSEEVVFVLMTAPEGDTADFNIKYGSAQDVAFVLIRSDPVTELLDQEEILYWNTYRPGDRQRVSRDRLLMAVDARATSLASQ